MFFVVHDATCLGTESKSKESNNLAEAGSTGTAQRDEPASSTCLVNKGVERGNETQQDSLCRSNASAGDLGGHADVTGSSISLPLRSMSSSAALSLRMRGQPTMSAGGEENAASEGDLMNCLLRATGTPASATGTDGSSMVLRRKRRSNATDLDAGVRERTSSPVCFGVGGELGQRMTGRRRSLPTPRLSVRDVAAAGCPLRPDDSAQSTACGGLQPFSDTTGVRQDLCLNDIDENTSITSSTSAAALDGSLITNNSTIDSDKTTIAGNSPIDTIGVREDKKVLGNTIDEQTLVEDIFTSTKVIESKKVDVAQQNVCIVTGGSPTDSVLRQTRSTVDVDETETWSSKWLPRRSQSLRLYRLRDHSSARGEVESQQLEANVQEFQTRAAPEREALRNRLRKLSLIYAASTDSDETSRTWPASRRPGAADAEEGRAAPNAVPEIPLRCGVDVVSASSSTSTLQLKYDTDSLSSQKDEGFETASISSDVYLSSSQRSSMCDCDAAPTTTTTTTLERRTDPTATKTADGTTGPQPETLPPPPASFLNRPETVDGETPCSSGANSVIRSSESVVLPRGEVQPAAEFDAQQHRPSDASSSVVSTDSVRGKRLSDTSTETSRNGSPGSVKNTGSVRQKAQTVGTRQTKIAARPAPAAPRRGSSLVPPSTSRNFGSTRAPAAATTGGNTTARTTTAVKSTVRPAPSVAAVSTSTSERRAAFQRSSSLRAADDRKLTPCSRAAPPPPSSAAFVRQSQTRATIAAPVLRTNKRVAAEARKTKVTTTTPTGVTHTSSGPPARPTTATSSTSSSVVPRPQRGRYRTSSNGSCSSTTSASAGPKLTSFRPVSSATTTTTTLRQPAAPVNVPYSSSKKTDRSAAASSSTLKSSSNPRTSTQPPISRLRAPVVTKKQSK